MNSTNAKLSTVVKNAHGKCSPDSESNEFSISSLASGIKCNTPTERNNPPEKADDKDKTTGLDLKLLERNGIFPVIMIIANIITIAESLMIVVIILEKGREI